MEVHTMKKSILVIGVVWWLVGPAWAADKPAKKVEMTGKLRTGIVAIGGETTGTGIQTKKGTFELDLGKNKELRQKAENLNGKTVKVTGSLVIRKGVAVKVRKIITVARLEEAKKK